MIKENDNMEMLSARFCIKTFIKANLLHHGVRDLFYYIIINSSHGNWTFSKSQFSQVCDHKRVD